MCIVVYVMCVWFLDQNRYCVIITLEALKYFYINQETNGFFQFEMIINVLVSCSRFIGVPMFWLWPTFKKKIV